MVVSLAAALMLLRLKQQCWSSPSWGHWPLYPSEKQRRWCYFLPRGKPCESKWKWIMRSTGFQKDMYQPCLCWSLIKEASVVAEKDGLCLLSFPASCFLGCLILCTCFSPTETSALALIPFLSKYTDPEDVIRSSCLQPCTYMGEESISLSLRLLLLSNWHWLTEHKITGEVSGWNKLERHTERGTGRLLS